jgi:hypothetical protein
MKLISNSFLSVLKVKALLSRENEKRLIGEDYFERNKKAARFVGE